MTICIAINSYYPAIGGIPNYYKYLAEILVSSGHTVIVLTIEDSSANDSIDEQGGIIKITLRSTYLKHLNHYKKYFRPGSYTAYQWISMGYAMKEWLQKKQVHYKIDIIETSDFGGAGIFLIDKDLPPVIITGHSSASQISEYSYMKTDDHLKVIKELERLSFKYCDAIVAHSPMNQQALARMTEKNIHFARAPWIIPSFLTKPEIKSGYVVISSLQMIKGAGMMAEAIRLAVKKESSLKIYWVGGDSYSAPGGEKVSYYLEKNYADIWNKNFIWLEEKEHPETLGIISQSKTIIIPSTWDTFNYVAIEAAYFERPLIITETTGASYLFKNEDGVMIIPYSSQKLSEAILENVSINDKEKNETGDIKQKIIDYFSPQNIIEDRMVLYNACIGERNKNVDEAVRSLSFLDRYTTSGRKYYYLFRKKLKKVIKGRN